MSLYTNDGHCRKGDFCQFAHGETELKINREIFQAKRKKAKNIPLEPPVEVNDPEPPIDPIGTQLSESSSPKPETMVDVFMSPGGSAGGSATEMLSSKCVTAAENNGGLRESNRARISLSTISEEEVHVDHESVNNMNNNTIPLLNNPVSNVISEQPKRKMLFGTSLSKNGGSAPVSAATATLTTQQLTTAKTTPITTQPLASTPVYTPTAAKRNYATIATPSPVSGAVSPSSFNGNGSSQFTKTPPVRHDGKIAKNQ